MPQVAAFVSAAVSSLAATGVGAFLTTTVVGRLLTSVALSALSQALAPRPHQPGIATEVTQTGGDTPVGFVLGRYATGGQLVCPRMSHGRKGKTPNAYLTCVIEVSDIPGMSLDAVIIDGETHLVSTTLAPHPDYGPTFAGRLAGLAWIRWYDGSQDAADPMLLAKYASYPDRPWQADMIGRGLCYAILTFRHAPKVFGAMPEVRFVVSGIPLYDPRQDSTAGGVGAQRWGDPATWAVSTNPVVMIHNILCGIALAGIGRWGGSCEAADLPYPVWAAAMDLCDAPVPLAGGGSQKRFRAGFEVYASQEPAEVIEELLKACQGQLADVGGRWTIQVNGPGLPVFFPTDAEVIVTSPQDFQPFPGLEQTFNGIHATYPAPDALWEPREAPPRTNPAAEAEDGGRRLVADVQFPAVPYDLQVQRLMAGLIRDHRRMRRHRITLPPGAAILEPLDTIGWTSAANGYVAKVFDVVEVVDDPMTLLQTVSLRERDPADYDWSTAEELADSLPLGSVIPPAEVRVLPTDTSNMVPDGDLQDDLAWSNPERFRQNDVSPIAGFTSRGDLQWIGAETGGTHLCDGQDFPVVPGDRLLCRGQVRGNGGAYKAQMLIRFSDREDAFLSAASIGLITASSSAVEAREQEIVVPAGATQARFRVAVFLDETLVGTVIRFGGPEVRRKIGRALVQDGAVTDYADVFNPGPFPAADALTNRATLDFGPIPPKTFQRRGVEFEARSPTYFTTGGGTVDNNMLRGLFQRRSADPGGAMGAWETLETFNIRSPAWSYYRDPGTTVGSYDDFEYRLAFEVVINGGSPGAYAATNVIRNLRVFSEANTGK